MPGLLLSRDRCRGSRGELFQCTPRERTRKKGGREEGGSRAECRDRPRAISRADSRWNIRDKDKLARGKSSCKLQYFTGTIVARFSQLQLGRIWLTDREFAWASRGSSIKNNSFVWSGELHVVVIESTQLPNKSKVTLTWFRNVGEFY